MQFADAIGNAPRILTEGSIYEKLRRDPRVHLDADIAHAGLIYDPNSAACLRETYKEYLDLITKSDMPILTFTSTWRANPDRIKSSRFRNHAVNSDNVEFLRQIRNEYGERSNRIFIGGLVGCRGDGYSPDEALDQEAAFQFHTAQTRSLSAAGVDFLFASTLPAFSEAFGIARAMARCGKPYALSFILRPNGALLDGMPLHEAVQRIDTAIDPKPMFYMINCVHPNICRSGFAEEIAKDPTLKERVIGLQGNTSRKSPEELETLEELDCEEPGVFADHLLAFHREFGTRILGGCCGTDKRHIAAIAKLLDVKVQ
jgi:homocysteine S-methyltransferase